MAAFLESEFAKMGKKSAAAKAEEEFKGCKREASVADMDRMTETEMKLGIFFRDFDHFEDWDVHHEDPSEYVRRWFQTE